MNATRKAPLRYLPKLHSHLQIRNVSTRNPDMATTDLSPFDPARLLRVCTILYQQQNSPDTKLYSHLRNCNIGLTHEFFLQVCNRFPYSWKPIYRFFRFSETDSKFSHSSTTYNKMLDIFGKSRNIDLLWGFVTEMAEKRIVTDTTIRIAMKTLADAREMKKCVEIFHLINSHELFYSVERLNKVVETLIRSKLVFEAKYIVWKLKPWIKPSEITYGFLVIGFCRVGDLMEACKVWNLMVDEGFEPNVGSCEEIMETLLKSNRFEDAMKLFQSLRKERIHDLGSSSYKILISWMCKNGKVILAHMLFDEMLKRGVKVDNQIFGALVYGLLCRGRVREGCRIVGWIENPDVGVYHELIKGFLRLRRAGEATQVFREMVERGCEPTMHTYIMLLQGHLGKRGRKGPDPLVNFDSIFVGGLVKLGKSLEATKYVERMMGGGVEVPRFDYNKFLYSFSNEEGVCMFEEVGKRLRDVGLVDLGDILMTYGEKMTTRERRRRLESL
ncbi:pentatricopeptide repeat (PPR) superfamily protein [Tasmannia lanceolata]|uniref:pentatricopeptide repeat (PPR) superfamily protein n=1 Tax=Tasmannia lanceolata TaxID=3420 RepID=UPI0040647C91